MLPSQSCIALLLHPNSTELFTVKSTNLKNNILLVKSTYLFKKNGKLILLQVNKDKKLY
jgi:hypothetical protein